MTLEKARKIFAKYKVNEQAIEEYYYSNGQEDKLFTSYLGDDLESEIKAWLMHCRKPLSDYAEARTFFMYLTTD